MTIPPKDLTRLRESCPPGSRVTLHRMSSDPHPVSAGSTGTLDFIDDAGTFHVTWDNGRTLGLILGADRFAVTPPEPMLLKLYMPMTLTVIEEDERYDPVNLDHEQSTPYADLIRSALRREHAAEGLRDLMEYYHRTDSLSQKVRSLVFTAEVRNGALWGVAECQVTGRLTPSELRSLKDYVAGQASDGFGEGFEQHPILTPDGEEIFAHLWWSEGWDIKTETERFSQTQQQGGMDFVQSL